MPEQCLPQVTSVEQHLCPRCAALISLCAAASAKLHHCCTWQSSVLPKEAVCCEQQLQPVPDWMQVITASAAQCRWLSSGDFYTTISQCR